MANIETVTIIGAGPAGIAAAIQLARYGLTPLHLEKERLGGLLKNANLVENYPGFPTGIPGMELVHCFEEQYKSASLEVLNKEVVCLDFSDGLFQINTPGDHFTSRRVLVASGTKAVKFSGLQIPPDLDHKVFYEVYPLLNLRGAKVAMVGGGDAAFDYALNLSKRNQVIILNRGERIKCLPLLWERAQAGSAIQYLANTEVIRLRPDPSGRMDLECAGPGGVFKVHADYLVGALGRVARLDFLSQQVREQCEKLTAEGRLYFIGDVNNGLYRQTAIAVGDGVRAAMQIYRREKGMTL